MVDTWSGDQDHPHNSNSKDSDSHLPGTIIDHRHIRHNSTIGCHNGTQSVTVSIIKAIRHTFNILSCSSYIQDTSRIYIRYAQSQNPSGTPTFPNPFRRLLRRSDPPLCTLGYPSRTSPQPTEEGIYGFHGLEHLECYKINSLPSTNEVGACEVFD